ncbi:MULTISPECIES: hypothetical protein [Clostridium]|uniref:hypothetical protein n=1 Tax=Clostridium TaxID=1485 RepID=UPI000826DEB4|nr:MULTISPECIES: hypothetical protein [Clostridium]PJI09925.1 hypothetical protein CUB90_19535 [Clostridium sp. CT7]
MKIKIIAGVLLVFSFLFLIAVNNKVYNKYITLENQNNMQTKKITKKKTNVSYKEIFHTFNKYKDVNVEDIKYDDKNNICTEVSFVSDKNGIMSKLNKFSYEKCINNISNITINSKDGNKVCKIELMLKKQGEK